MKIQLFNSILLTGLATIASCTPMNDGSDSSNSDSSGHEVDHSVFSSESAYNEMSEATRVRFFDLVRRIPLLDQEYMYSINLIAGSVMGYSQAQTSKIEGKDMNLLKRCSEPNFPAGILFHQYILDFRSQAYISYLYLVGSDKDTIRAIIEFDVFLTKIRKDANFQKDQYMEELKTELENKEINRAKFEALVKNIYREIKGDNDRYQVKPIDDLSQLHRPEGIPMIVMRIFVAHAFMAAITWDGTAEIKFGTDQ